MAIKTSKLVAQIPEDLYEQLRLEAQRDDRSITAVVRRALREYFKDASDGEVAA